MKKVICVSLVTLIAASFAGSAAAGQGGKRHGKRSDHMFERLDQDKDGRVTSDEVQGGHKKLFSRIDENGDGVVTRDEAQKAVDDRRAHHIDDKLERHDENGDGKLSRQELSRMPDHMFARIDDNGDGMLTRGEMLASRQARRGHRGDSLFDRADTNQDDRVTVEEAAAQSQRWFDRLDENGDGAITRDEAKRRGKGKGHRKGHGKHGHGHGGVDHGSEARQSR